MFQQIHAFLVYALIGCVNFIKNNKLIDFIKSSLGFFIGSLFHGPIILGFFFFLIYIFFKVLIENNYFLRFKKKNIFYIFLLPIFLLPIITYFLGYYSIPKLGNFKDLASIKIGGKKKELREVIEFGNRNDGAKVKIVGFEDAIIWKINKSTRSSNNSKTGAAFPSWTIPQNITELIYLIPVRMFYFLYSPFPWDIKRPAHLVGLLDSFFYIYLSYCILHNLKILNRNSQTRFLVIILIAYVFIYCFGVGNFGTSIRHRLKFIGILIAIAAPKILRIRFAKIK